MGWNLSAVKVVFYRDKRGRTPVLDWILDLDEDAKIRSLAKIERLEQAGHKLDRPDAAHLRDKIYELRITSNRKKYRVLYFFHERKAVVLCHAFLKKTQKVPKRDIEKAVNCKRKFESDPLAHTYGENKRGQIQKKKT